MPIAPEKRNQELERFDEMRRNAEQRFPLAQVEADQPQVEHLQISEPAVDDARRSGRRPAAEIPPLHEQDAQTAHGGVARDATADDAAADDCDVERFPLKTRQSAHSKSS